MTRDVFDVMRESHAIHAFMHQDVPKEDLSKILEAACWAPSAGNLQPWYLYVVKNEHLKEKIAEACYHQPQVKDAPVIVAILADPARSNESYGERGAQLYCLQDSATAAQNMLLAAEALGLGTCWVGAFDEVKVQKLLESPPRLRAVALVCIGYSDEDVQLPKNRRRVSEVTKIIH